MKKATLVTLIAVWVSTFSLSSCKKYEEGGRMSKKAANKNIVNTWEIDKLFDDGFDVSQGFIQTNYHIIIKDDNTYNIQQRGTMIENGKWELSSNLKFFVRSIQNGPQGIECEIIKLTADEFWFKVTEQNKEREYRLKERKI